MATKKALTIQSADPDYSPALLKSSTAGLLEHIRGLLEQHNDELGVSYLLASIGVDTEQPHTRGHALFKSIEERLEGSEAMHQALEVIRLLAARFALKEAGHV